MKTIEITAKEWFDKINGNSYFSAEIVTNYGTDKEKIFKLPFQYGYGTQYLEESKNILTEFNLISPIHGQSLKKYCNENNIVLNTRKIENCKKSELKN